MVQGRNPFAVDELARRAIGVAVARLAMGCEVFNAAGATFIRNRAAPRVRDMNHIRDVTARTPADMDALFARAEEEFAAFPHRRYDVTPWTPAPFEARLLLEGYEPSTDLLLVLEGELQAEPRPIEVEAIQSEADWEALGVLMLAENEEWSAKQGIPADKELAEGFYLGARSKDSFLTWWLAFIEGRPCGYFSSWKGFGKVGQVEDLFVHPDFRLRGVATALMAKAVADCRDQGAGPVIIVCDHGDTPKNMYASMGFTPIAVKRQYRKAVPSV